jgi:hypothetical protein
MKVWLARASARTLRSKRRSPGAAWYLFREHTALERLRAELEDGTWRPYGFFVRRDPKPRAIAVSAIEDRVHRGGRPHPGLDHRPAPGRAAGCPSDLNGAGHATLGGARSIF